MTARPPIIQTDPEVGIPDLIRRLTDDSKRLVSDEVRLAKLEAGESARLGARGTLRLAIAFGVGVVAMVSATVFLAAGLGRLLGNYWAGALLTGVIELGIAAWLVTKGIGTFGKASFTFEESRKELRNTTRWVAAQRAD